MQTRARYVLAKAREVLRPLGGSRLVRSLPWLSLAAGFEAYGRWSQNDGMDAVGVVGLAVVFVWFHGRHGEWLGELWTDRWEPRLRAWTAPWRIRYGVDLRGAPELLSAQPRAWLLTWLGMMVATACIFATAQHWPGDARVVLRQASGLVWLLVLSGLWGTLLCGSLFLGFLMSTVLREQLLGLSARGRTMTAWALFCGGIACLALPLNACLIALVSLGFVSAATDLLLRPRLRMIWCRADGDQSELRWSQGPYWSVAGNSALIALACAFVLLSSGDRLFGSSADTVAITGLWGICFAKASTFALGVLTFSSLLQLVGERSSDPARPAPGRVMIHNAQWRQFASLRRALAESDLKISFSSAKSAGSRARCDVEVRLDEEADPFELVLQREWPLGVASGQLADSRLHEILRRRVVIQRRRGFYRGLRRVMRAAGSREYEQGSGFWVAPHLWYLPAMTRDEDDGIPMAVAPPYRKLIARESRAHVHDLLRDLQIDLLFVEDGVGYRKLQRVFAQLFAFHDRQGPKPLQSRSFTNAVQGVRTVLHDFQVGTGHGQNKYPEPDYETLGRARILHVFRDRGGDEEKSLVPDTFDYLPMPVLS